MNCKKCSGHLLHLVKLLESNSNDELYSETNLLIHYPSVIPIAKLGPYSCSDPIFRRVCTQSEAAPHASNLPFATIDQIYYTNIPL